MRAMYVFASLWNTKDWIWSMEGRLGDFEDECRHYKRNAQGALFGESQPQALEPMPESLHYTLNGKSENSDSTSRTLKPISLNHAKKP